jgi:hypothetical protein
MDAGDTSMKAPLGILSVALIMSGAHVSQDSFESVREGFRRKVVALLHEQEVPTAELEARLGALAVETFGAHPRLLRHETEERLAALPGFPGGDLSAWVERASLQELPALPPELERTWLVLAWDPARLAGWAKNLILSRSSVSRTSAGARC